MDIGGIIKAPFEDQDWLKKLLLMGAVSLLVCITVIGIFVAVPNLMGWGITFARNRVNGRKELPDFGFGYIGLGYRAIVAGLVLAVPAFLGGIVLGVVNVALQKMHLSIVGALLSLAYMLALLPFGIATMVRFIAHDDILAGFRFGWLLSFITGNVGTILIGFVVAIIVTLIQMAMGIVPIVGGMFGMAFGVAALNALYAEIIKSTNTR
jgi:hypothetical protein